MNLASRRSGAAWVAMALAFVFAASPARAQATPAPSDREAQRTDIYKQAVDLANAGHWEEAEGKLQEVLAIRASPKARFTLGQAQEHVGQLAEAYDSYQQAMNEAQLTGQAEVTRVAGPALQALESRVPVLRLVVSGTSASGASATIDDRPALLDRSVRVDPGAHRVSVSAPGARTATNSVTLAEGQHLDVPVHLDAEVMPPVPSVPSDEASTAPARSNPWPVVGLAAAGVGIVGLGVGTYFGIDAISKDNASNRAGCQGNTCPTGAYSTREDAKSSANLSTIAFVAGGILAAGGVTLWLLAPRGNVAVQVAPTALLGGGGATLGGVWR